MVLNQAMGGKNPLNTNDNAQIFFFTLKNKEIKKKQQRQKLNYQQQRKKSNKKTRNTSRYAVSVYTVTPLRSYTLRVVLTTKMATVSPKTTLNLYVNKVGALSFVYKFVENLPIRRILFNYAFTVNINVIIVPNVVSYEFQW